MNNKDIDARFLCKDCTRYNLCEYYHRRRKDSYICKYFHLSVTPQEPKWIPTNERLPEEDGEYYATIYDTDENYQYMDIAELEDGIWQYKDYIKVLAWMPLPKPYEPQKSEDNK